MRKTKTNSKNSKTEAFFENAEAWRAELMELRAIILTCGLTEELKWNKPCYTLEGSNVVILIPLKETCALMFCKGALLKDAQGILTKPGEHTQAGRWIKFTRLQDIAKRKAIIKSYICEAIDVEKSGLKVRYKKPAEFKAPDELQDKLDANPALKKAFAALTPGRQRAYFIYFSGAKQSTTRIARIEKCAPQILKGKGLNDDYRSAKK